MDSPSFQKKPVTLSVEQEQMTIEIGTENLTSCLNFLVSNKIPFNLNYASKENCKVSQVEETTSEAVLPPSRNKVIYAYKDKYEEIARTIYDKYIKNITNVPPPTTKELSAEFKISSVKLKTIFLRYYGKPFFQVYMDRKMDYAAKLLRQGASANEASEAIGYLHPIKFNKMFQKYFGTTPLKYKKQNAK